MTKDPNPEFGTCCICVTVGPFNDRPQEGVYIFLDKVANVRIAVRSLSWRRWAENNEVVYERARLGDVFSTLLIR